MELCLVLNKIDRLVLQKKYKAIGLDPSLLPSLLFSFSPSLSFLFLFPYIPLEAYEHLKNILEQVNAVYASFAREESFRMLEQKRGAQVQTAGVCCCWSLFMPLFLWFLIYIAEEEEEEDEALNFKSMIISDATIEMEDSNADEFVSKRFFFISFFFLFSYGLYYRYFHPEKGNVVFASAKDKWGFRVHDFAAVYAQKFKMSYNVLVKTLWGDFYLNKKVLCLFVTSFKFLSNPFPPFSGKKVLQKTTICVRCPSFCSIYFKKYLENVPYHLCYSR